MTQKNLPRFTISVAVLFGDASLIGSSKFSSKVSNNGSEATVAGQELLPSLSRPLRSATVIIASIQHPNIVVIIICKFIIIFVANLIIIFGICKYFVLNL